MQIGQVVWNTVSDAIKGLASASTWIWNNTKQFFDAAFKGFGHIFDDIVNGFKNLLNDYQAFKAKLDAFLGPVMGVWRAALGIWNQYIQPIFRFVMKWTTAIRKVLGLLKLLHVGWAQQLDAWVAQFQAKVVQVDLQLLGYIREVGTFVNLAFDPLGLLRANVFVRSFVAAIDQVAIAFTGHPWAALWAFDLYGGSRPGPTANINSTMNLGLQDVMQSSGDAGDIAQRSPQIRTQVFSELGVTGVPGV